MNHWARTAILLLGLVALGGCAALTPQHKLALDDGRRAYERKRFAEAIQRTTLVINEADYPPGVAMALYIRGMSNAWSGQRARAYTDLQRCVAMDAEPEVTWKAYVVLGYLHFEEEQWEPALRAYSAALSRMPPEPPIDEVCFNLGQCYERLGRWVEAQVFFRRITERYLFSKIAVKAQRRLDIRPTHFAVQCGAFRQLDNAERMQADLEQKGLLAYIREERRGSTTLHIVLVGRYATYDEGQRGLATVQQYVSDALLWP